MATTSIPANCQAVENALLQESGRLSGEMYQRIARKRPIVRLLGKTRGAWQNGMGTSVSAVTFEKAFPALTGDPWEAIANSDGDALNACRPPNEVVTFGQTSRAFTPKHYSVNTQDFCIKDIQTDWQFQQFFTSVNKALDIISEWVWARRFILDYFEGAGHNLTLNGSGPDSLTITDQDNGYSVASPATVKLSMGVLNDIKLSLNREGGDKPTMFDEMTNEPVHTVIVSAETFQHILRDSPDIVANVRYAYMGAREDSPLIPGLPTKKQTFGGWNFEVDPFPRRFVISGGAYVEVASHVRVATTKGYKWNVNSAWKVAPYEESIVFHEDNIQELSVNTITSPAPGWNFDARSWMGEFTPRNILDRTCNQDGTIIYMRALYASAARPVNPEVGYTILHARCSLPYDTKSCDGYDYSN